MSRLSIPALILFVAALLPATALAEGVTLGVRGGVSIPSGDFGDSWKTGFMVGATGEMAMGNQLAFGVDFDYTKNDPSDDVVLAPDEDAEFSFIHVGAFGKWLTPISESVFRPYLVGGAGIYSVGADFESGGVTTENDQTAFGFRFGVGFNYKMSPTLSLGAEADYHHVLTDEEEIGVDSTPFVALLGGISYSFMGGM